ncbi:hypothetical protein BH09VER1_BH09VER1_33290 [soil metagenome]
MRRYLLFFLLPIFSLHAAEKYPVTIRLHAEGKETDSSTFVKPVDLTFPKKHTFIEIVPIVNERDIVSFYPFPNQGSIGAYFQLDADGTNKLAQHTIDKKDNLVMALIDGRLACVMLVDKKITNGLMMIPYGFTPEEILLLQTRYPTISKEKEFSAQKKKAEARIAEMKKNQPKPTPTPKK